MHVRNAPSDINSLLGGWTELNSCYSVFY